MSGSMDRDRVSASLDAVRRRLEDIKHRIYEELRNYPPQVAGCDVQFQHLAEERDRVVRELARLDDVCREAAAGADLDHAIEAFVRSSVHFDHSAARPLRP